MAEMRKVTLHPSAKGKQHGVVSSTYFFENKKYQLVGNLVLNVDLVVANGWVAADPNVIILPER